MCAAIGRLGPNVKAGTLRFWGSWFGKPHDNWHRVRGAETDEDKLIIHFGEDELLTVWSPRGGEFGSNVFAIREASRVRWDWYYYGRPRTPSNRYFEDFRRGDSISVETNVDWYTPVFETDLNLPAVQIL
jgi:hypothetical protein